MLRPLTGNDLELIVTYGLALTNESPVYKSQDIVPEHSLRYLQAAWNAGILFGVVHEHGAMIGSVNASWTSPTLHAFEWMLYVEPDYRRSRLAFQIVELFEDLARERGAVFAYAGSSTGINDEGVRRLYERLGYTSVGSALKKELACAIQQPLH